MLCEVCGKNQAFIYYEEKVKHQVRKIHLCRECASKEGISSVFAESYFNISDIITSLSGGVKPDEASGKQAVCKHCGTTYEEFIKSGLLGCCQCYNYLEDSLKPLFRRIHGSTHHTGKAFPNSIKPEVCDDELVDLEEQLKQAVAREEFELAAELRDRLRSLKNQCSPSDLAGTPEKRNNVSDK